jgi:hypothetical protein
LGWQHRPTPDHTIRTALVSKPPGLKSGKGCDTTKRELRMSSKLPHQPDMSCFVFDEEGAVTVDWVVLSAAVIGMGMLVLGPIAFSADSVSKAVSEDISDIRPGYGQ